MNGKGPMVFIAAAVVVPLLFGGGVALLALARSPLDSAAAAQPVITHVGQTTRHDKQPVSVTLHPAEVVQVRAQASGIITGLAAPLGQQPDQGQTLMHVSGRPVVAYVAAAPLYRPISSGMEGDDVTGVVRMLTAQGFLTADAQPTDSAFSSAISAFNESLGLSGTTLDPASVVWVPEGGVITETTAHVGDSVTPGTQVFASQVGADRIDVTVDAAAMDRTLTLGMSEAVLPAEATSITDSDQVQALREQLGESTTGTGFLTAADDITVGTIPASAVVTDVSGARCYFPDTTGAAIAMSATEGSYGLVEVPVEQIGQPVLANPRQVRQDLTCG